MMYLEGNTGPCVGSFDGLCWLNEHVPLLAFCQSQHARGCMRYLLHQQFSIDLGGTPFGTMSKQLHVPQHLWRCAGVRCKAAKAGAGHRDPLREKAQQTDVWESTGPHCQIQVDIPCQSRLSLVMQSGTKVQASAASFGSLQQPICKSQSRALNSLFPPHLSDMDCRIFHAAMQGMPDVFEHCWDCSGPA